MATANDSSQPTQKSPNLSVEELRRIEEKLRNDLTEAREKYLEASKHNKELMALTGDLGLNHPDGRLSQQSAVKEHHAAFVVCARALRIFNYFIFNGKLPELTEGGLDD